MVKKGLIFYMDAILALILTLVIVAGIGIYYSVEPELRYRTVHAEAEDMMQLMSQKVNVTELGLPENYTDKTFLEVIGTLWLTGNQTEATQLAQYVLDDFDRRCVELVFEDEVIYKNDPACDEEGKNVVVANRVTSGYTTGKKPDGYMARAILNKMKRITSEYIYFGGYVGDGNVTKNMTLRFIDKALEAKMELDVGSDFNLFVNGQPSGTYSPSAANMSSDVFIICNETYQSSYCDNFEENNSIEFRFLDINKSYIGGGNLRVRYNTTDFEIEEIPDEYVFPGIDGIINLYSSFYVPGTLHDMNAFLHYKSNFTVFFNIGDALIYNGSTNEGEEINVTITNSEIEARLLAGGLNYSELGKKTVPLRFGMQNVSYIVIGQEEGDVFSVTDISGSMDECNVPSNSSLYDCTGGYCSGGSCTNGPWWCCWLSCCDWDEGRCNQCGGTWIITDYFREKINVAKEANEIFIDIVLNYTGNKVGLVAYESNVDQNDCHDLSTDNVSLKSKVNEWVADGGTCICCGINEAVDKLLAQSSQDRFQSMVVMSDGEANRQCARQGTGNAKDDAIEAACDAWNDHEIKVYAIGFGDDVHESTMQSIADCGHGEYYYSNVSELIDIYKLIAKEILNASYVAQSVEVYGGEYENITLYSDSYLKFNFTPEMEELEYGEIAISVESPKFGGIVESPKNGTFVVPNGTRVMDAKITSYSSEYWTDRAFIHNGSSWNHIYRLWDYGDVYQDLGDPYVVYIPIEEIMEGENQASIDTGASEENTTGGSPDSRVIYTLAVNVLMDYGGVFNKTQGSNKQVYYDMDLDRVADGFVYITLGNDSDPWDPDEDAIDNALAVLLDKLNFYNDTGSNDGDATNPVDVHPGELSFEMIPVGGIPWLWGPGIFTLKVW